MKTTTYLITLFLFCILASCANENEKENNENTQQEFVNGKIINASGCKSNTKELLDDARKSQVDYIYDISAKTLTLKHINSAFNCCPDSLGVNISFVKDTIIIEELEYITNPCDCNCLYDLDIQAINVEPKKYVVKFAEFYFRDEKKLLFNIDLSEKINGSFSVERDEYPWGF